MREVVFVFCYAVPFQADLYARAGYSLLNRQGVNTFPLTDLKKIHCNGLAFHLESMKA
jgi:hypothetical protein